MTPTITEEQRRQLEDDGYVVLENVFTLNEMTDLAGHIETYQVKHQKHLEETSGAEGISRANEILFTDHLAEKDDNIRAFCTRPEFVGITTQLLGPDIDLYWNQSVFKHPEGKKEFPWHQDDGYGLVEPSPYLTLWLALNDATEENGCISVLPRSHKQGVVEHRSSPIGHICYDNDAPDQGIKVPMKAGSMAVFWSRTFHKSGPNVSDGSRKAYVIQYSHAGLRNGYNGELFEGLIPIARDGQTV